METNMITIPFDVERAKKIQAGEEPGKIVTRAGRNVRVVCWDVNEEDYPIVGIITNDNGKEWVTRFTKAGKYYVEGGENKCDLMLQVPEWTQFKDGDVLACETHNGPNDYCKWFSILKGEVGLMVDNISFRSYVSYDHDSSYHAGKLTYDEHADNIDTIRLATEEEKQKFVKRLQEEHTEKAKDILKRFFGIEEKQEQKFEFLQPVLVRGAKWSDWLYGEFTHKNRNLFFVSGGNGFSQCIPYNEQTKHLLGTTDNWEE